MFDGCLPLNFFIYNIFVAFYFLNGSAAPIIMQFNL